MIEQEHRKKQRLSSEGEEGGAASPGAAANDCGEAGAAAPPLKSAAAGGTQPQAAAVQQLGGAGRRLVLVWDLDETLLLFNSLLVGTWAAATQQPQLAEQATALGRRWEAAILALCDSHFFFEQLEEWDQCCLADILQHDDGASLAGRDFRSDGFPPPGADQLLPPRSPERHASAARPAPAIPPPDSPGQRGATGGQGAGGRRGAAAGQSDTHAASKQQGDSSSSSGHLAPPSAAGASPWGSPACASLDAAALTKLAYRYRCVSKLCSFGLHALGTTAQRQEWEELYRATDALTGGWLSHASALLAGCSSQLASSSSSRGEGPGEVTHVAVTSGQLLPSLAKLLLFKLGSHISVDHVWSSRYCGKAACFQRVQQRFGGDAAYVAIGDGIEEDEAAAGMGWPYVRVLLAPAANYPADRVLSWRTDAATGGPGLPFTHLRARHIATAAGLPLAWPSLDVEAAHGSSAAAEALVAPVMLALQ